MKIITVSTDYRTGGAGIAAWRTHAMLKQHTAMDVRLLTSSTQIYNEEGVYFEPLLRRKIRRIGCRCGRIITAPFINRKNGDLSSFSLLPLPFNSDKALLDHVKAGYKPHLHWFNHEFISLNIISKICAESKVFWTAHDMWPILAFKHYGETDIFGMNKLERLASTKSIGIKRELYRRNPITIIAPSKWLGEHIDEFLQIGSSSNVEIVPNPVPSEFFSKEAKVSCRSELGLPIDKKILLFSTAGRLNEPRKGYSYLVGTIRQLLDQRNDIHLVTLGRYDNYRQVACVGGITHLGRIDNIDKLAKVYRACDLVVVPSIQDNLPQVATEAQAAGRPVAAFKIGGLTDIVDDDSTGCLAKELSFNGLYRAIQDILQSDMIEDEGETRIRSRALTLWSNEVISGKLTSIYDRFS